MRAFDFYAAKDATEAVALLAQHGPAVKVLAGGTDLLADLKFANASHAPKVVVDISRAQDLRGIETTEQGLRIGALVTHTEIMRSPVIRDLFPALVDAAHTIGAVQTRNLGTLGGNLVTAVPSMDSGPTLVALDAIVTVAGSEGRRQMPLAEFFVGPRKTVLKPHELLVEIIIPKENVGKPAHFLKFGLQHIRRTADRAWRRRAESHPRDLGRELSRRKDGHSGNDGRGGQARRQRCEAD
jgi:xanthine dehydrogenase FAD-binding subunit